MKKTAFKAILPAALALTIGLNGFSASANASASGMTALKKYNTEETILLNGQPIYIPELGIEQPAQFRGVWISTVYNLDFPSAKGLTEEAYKKAYIALLDNLEKMNINAVVFQVRPKLDAFYQSKLNPWSEFLTGAQGQAPGWDPLAWMVEETHDRSMEFHAWFNPYRVTTASDNKKTKNQILSQLASNNWARKNPQCVYKFEGKLYLNPGEPAVVQYINDSVMEVVTNYDIDAVHFDDYFYPYRSVSAKDVWYAEEEKAVYNKYGQAFGDVAQWRRNNVDVLIKSIRESIDAYNQQNKKSVQFGVSPYGIWGHYEKHPEGSAEGTGSKTPVTSLSSYDNLYADARKWVKNNWIDYIAPQIYWTFDEKAAPYGELADWWANTVKGTDCQLYVGHASYKYVDSASASWRNAAEIPNQLKFNSMYEEIKGSAFFSYRFLLKADEGAPGKPLSPERIINNRFVDILSEALFCKPALLPAKPWLDHEETGTPRNLSAEPDRDGVRLSWEDEEANDSAYYIIYRVDNGNESGIEKAPADIIKKIRRQKDSLRYSFVDTAAAPDQRYTYAVTAVDRAQNETGPAEIRYPADSRYALQDKQY